MKANNRFRRLFRLENDSRDIERAVDDELQFHFHLAVRDLMARGATEDDARREARRRFGDVERTRRGLAEIDRARVSETRRSEWWSNVWQDLRYALRGLRRKPGFAVAVVVILALGIGANATMFGIVDRLLLRAPAFLETPDQVQRIYLATTINGKEFFGSSTSFHRYHDLTDSAKSIDVAVAFWTPSLAIGVDDPREMRITYATASYWKLFRVRPHLGRFYTADEDIPRRAANVVVLAYTYWQSAFGAADDVVGKTLRIGRLDYTIIGVAPRGFTGLATQHPAAFVPLSSGADNSFGSNARQRWEDAYEMNWMQVVVRRRADVSVAAATTEFSEAYRRSYDAGRALNPGTASTESARPHVAVAPVLSARGPNQGTDVKVAVWLVGVALIVLLIACANVSNLLLARALQRQREIAVRLALGISRSRLLLQLLVESTVLALLGGVAGLVVAEWGGRILRITLLPNEEGASTMTDARTLLFTAVIAIGVGVLTGSLPAWRAGSTSLAGSLKAGSREGTHQRSRLRSSLLVVQAALSVVLLVGAGLFVRSLHNVQHMHLGFDADHIAYVEPHMRGERTDSTRRRALVEDMLRAARAVPGVSAAASAAMVPFVSEWEAALFVAGVDSVNNRGSFLLQVVSPGYFDAMGTRIARGRALDESDRAGAPLVAVVSQSMAQSLWPGRDAISQCLRVDADTMPCRYVVGIAEDIRYTSLTDDAGLQYYLPSSQRPPREGVLFVRLTDEAVLHKEAIRAAVQRAMPGTSYVTVNAMSEVLEPVRRSWQLGATMFALFGALALIVASIGLYSVISYSVAQRTQEMGVRVALGAQASDVVRMILRQSVTLSALAVVLGVGVALLAARWIEPLLFQTSAYDPWVYGGVVTALLLVAVAAALAPAMRAARVNASIALRSD